MMADVRGCLASFACCLFLMVGADATNAATLGPIYPPPGGTIFSGSGNPGSGAGKSNNYSAFDNSFYSQLYWGWADVGMGTSPLAGGSGLLPMTLDSSFGTGVMTWVTNPNAVTINTASGTQHLTGRFTATLSTGTWMDPSLAAGGGISGGPDAVTQVTGDFSVTGLFQVLYGSTWYSFNDLFNALSTTTNCGSISSPAGCTLTNLNGQFWYTDPPPADIGGAVPLPAALPLFASGLVGLGLLGWRRKRKAPETNAA